jgi:DNA-binding SARP family transcriptional activator
VRQGVDETEKLGPKHLALLIYIFHEHRPMHPSEVTDMLGRGQDEEKESDALKRAVTWLRENIPGINVRLSGETIEAFGGVQLDTREVDAAIDGGDALAVRELYLGEFLEGFESGSPAFDEWARKERGRLKRAWNHAMLSAAQAAERKRRWDDASEWWQVLVARAPMRPEAVASLLSALAECRQVDEAARAFADYTARLQESGIAQPADPVKEAIAKYKILQDVADGRIKPPPVAAEPARPAARRVAPPVEPEPEPMPDIPDMEITAPPTQPAPPVVSEEPPAAESPVAPAPPAPEVTGFQAGAAPPMRAGAPSPTPTEKAPEGAWDEIVDIASSEDFDIPVTKKAGGAGTVPAPPGISAPRDDKPPAADRPRRTPRKEEEDEGLKAARKAAEAFKDEEYGIVRHQVTSVRKEWGPVLKKAWEDSQPWRQDALDQTQSTLRYLGALLLAGLTLAGRGLKSFGVWSLAAATALGGSFKTRGRRWSEARKAKPPKKPKVKRPKKPKVKRPKKKKAKRRKKAAPEAVEVPPWEAEIARPQPESAEAAPRQPVATPEPETVEAPPWDDVPREPEPEPVETSPWVDPPEEAAAPAAAASGYTPWTEVGVEAAPRVKRRPTIRLPAVGPVFRRFWYVPVVLAVIGSAVVFGPRVVGLVGGLADDLPDVQAPSLPSVSLPRVTLRTPSFVETGVSRIAEMLSGSLLEESGEWLLLADVEIDAPTGEEGAAATDIDVSAAVLTLALEADLRQARFFFVVPYERALLARRRQGGGASETLPLAEALALAGAEGYAAVISGRLTRHVGVDSVRLQVLNAAGDTLYGVAAELTEGSSALETLVGLTPVVRRRLGEPGDDIETSLPPTQILSTSVAALEAYARARIHYYAGRYSSAITSSRRAASRDSTFAMAHRLLAEAYALNGQRRSARGALESAWRFSERLTERERMRILADRHAWDGRLEEAVLTYDDLFYNHRDDVGALKSQALLQRTIGVRGGGEGNLRVAYTVDPHDWPALSRIARYLGYGGRLPNVDSLVASLQESQ